MGIKFDHYLWWARVLPVYLTAAPVVLAIAAILPDGLNLQLAGASAVVFVPLSYLLSQVGADLGKRLEPGLWRSWGGPPSIRFLRHDNDEYNPETRARLHEQLRGLGLRIPTEEEERADRAGALQLYGAVGDELRGRTRDGSRFPLLAKTNIEYGFRRNALGLKPLGLPLALVSLAGSGWVVLHGWRLENVLSPVPFAATLLILCIVAGWLVGVRPHAVRLPADRYARALFETPRDLEPPE